MKTYQINAIELENGETIDGMLIVSTCDTQAKHDYLQIVKIAESAGKLKSVGYVQRLDSKLNPIDDECHDDYFFFEKQ